MRGKSSQSWWEQALGIAPGDETKSYLGFPEIIRRAIPENRAYWKSRQLSTQPIAFNKDPGERVIRIINEAADQQSTTFRQTRKFFPKENLQSEAFWSRLAESYDTLYAFSDGHRELFEKIDEALPKKEVTILDIGGGTLNVSTYLSLRSPERTIVAIDLSAKALSIGAKKLALVGTAALHQAAQISVFDPAFAHNSADGAVMFDVLFTMKNKKAALEKVYANLRGGATLVLIDPLPRVRSQEVLKGLLTEMALSAVANHSPMNDFDLALLAVASLHRMNRVRGNGGGASFMGPDRMERLVKEAGFHVDSSESALRGLSRILILKK